jgi:hypothetical protein
MGIAGRAERHNRESRWEAATNQIHNGLTASRHGNACTR